MDLNDFDLDLNDIAISPNTADALNTVAQTVAENVGVPALTPAAPQETVPPVEAVPVEPVQSAALPPPQEIEKPAFDIYTRLREGHGREHLDHMAADFRGRLSRLIEEAPPHVRDGITINSGYRSVQRQQELFDEAVKKYGSPEAARRWVAPPGGSKHNHGHAADLGFANEEVRKYVHENAARYGLHFPMGHEPWHIEPRWARRGSAAYKAPSDVKQAVIDGARTVGISPGYMLGMTGAESAFNPNAAASTSGAEGLHQFIPQTWLATLKKHGALYGYAKYADAITQRPNGKYEIADPALAAEALALRRNPVASSIMAAAHTKDNKEALESYGIINPGYADLYAAHFLGIGGARRFLTGLRNEPNAPAYSLASADAVRANRPIFFKKNGQARTAQEVYELFDAKVNNVKVTDDLNSRTSPTASWSTKDVFAPPPPPQAKNYTDAAIEVQRMKNREEGMGFFAAVGAEWNRGLTMKLDEVIKGHGFTPDPSYSIENDYEWLTSGIAPQYHARFQSAVSLNHAVAIREQALRDTKIDQGLQDLGWSGTAASIIASVADPASLLVGIMSGGTASAIATSARAGWIGSRLLGAAGGAAGNVAIDASLNELSGREQQAEELLLSAAVGGLLGGMFGPIGRNVATQREAAALQMAAQREIAELQGVPFPAGAAVNEKAVQEALSDRVFRGVQQESVPETAIKSLRLSEGGKAAASVNPISRMIGGMLGVDTVGKKGLGVNPHSADQEVIRYFKVNMTEWRQSLLPAYHEWAKEQGYNFLERAIGRGWKEFNEQITLYRRQTDPQLRAQYSETVRRVGDAKTAIYKRMASDQQNPNLAPLGKYGGSVKGAEGLVPDEFYEFRVWSPSKLTFAINEFGEAAVIRTIASAIKRQQADIDDALALKFANAIVRSPFTRAMGHDERLESILTNADTAYLAKTLRDEFRFTEDEIRRLLSQLRKTEPNIEGHLKHRILLDESHVEDLGNGRSLAVSRLLENDADLLMAQYTRKVAGRVALARQRFVNPINNDVVIGGIKSDADFDRAIDAAEAWGRQNLDLYGNDPSKLRKELEGLRWMYDRIKGVPDPAQLNDWAEWLRVSRNFNFARLGGQMGFAQLMDVGRIVGALGMRSFAQHIRPFKRMLDADGKWIQAHGLDRELEAVFGLGTDPLRGFQALVLEEAGAIKAPVRGRVVDKANAITEAMASVTSYASGMQHINAWLQLAVGRGIAQKFATMATGRISKADLSRVRFIGLDEDMLNRVLAQVRNKFTMEDGFLFGKKVARLNLDQWTDIEARAAFERALFRWSRHIVQENDVGSLHRMMSHPMAQALMQFRSYAMTAWENQLLHGIAHRDPQTAMTFLMSMFSGAMVYTAQTHLQAIGRSDADEFLEKRLYDPMAFGTAVFQRAGFASLVPMAADTMLMFTPVGGIFDARTTSQPTDALFGNPTAGLITDLAKASKHMMNAAFGDEGLTQQQLRAAQRTLFWQNTMPFVQLFSGMISDLPEK